MKFAKLKEISDYGQMEKVFEEYCEFKDELFYLNEKTMKFEPKKDIDPNKVVEEGFDIIHSVLQLMTKYATSKHFLKAKNEELIAKMHDYERLGKLKIESIEEI